MCSDCVYVPLYLARIGGPHLLWTVDMLARSFTKWNKACVKRLARLISSINPTKHHEQCICWRHRSGTANKDYFSMLLLLDIGKIPKLTSGGVLSEFGSQTFVPTSSMCRKYTSMAIAVLCSETCSHSDAEGNVTRPNGKRHSSAHSIEHICHVVWLCTFQATFQRVHAQPDLSISRKTRSSLV